MTTELEKKKETALSKPRPRGFEEESMKEDLVIPRATLLQGLSPDVQEDSERFRAGMIINSLTKEVLPAPFVPIFKYTEWIRFNPRNNQDPNFNPEMEPGAMIWKSSDPFDTRVQREGMWGENGEPPVATKFLNFLSLFPGVNMPVVIGFARTSSLAGKQLLSLCQFSEEDMFRRKYSLSAKKVTNTKGTFYVLKVDLAGLPTEEEFAKAERWWDMFHAKPIHVDDVGVEQADGEAVPF